MQNRKHKILYIITKSNWGGAQRYIYDLAEHFSAELEFEVLVALGSIGALSAKLAEKNIRTIVLPELQRDVRIAGDIKSFVGIIRLLLREKPDIVHLNSSKAGFIGVLACFFLKAYGLRLTAVFTAHGWAFNEPRPLWQKVIIALMQWKTVFLCNKTIVVSEYLKTQTRWWPFVSRKISVIHNGIPELEFLPREEASAHIDAVWKTLPKVSPFPVLAAPDAASSSLRQNLSWVSHTPSVAQGETLRVVFHSGTGIVTIAELHKNKGLDVAIEALALMKDKNFSYTIIGDGDERPMLETLIKKHGLKDRIFLAGHIHDAYKYLKAFDLFLLPSRTEALSYALLEAAQAGLPVVASRVGGIPEIVEHKKTGLLVPAGNPRALAHALRYMIANPDERADAGRELQNTIRNKFMLETMLEKTEMVYREEQKPQ